MNCYAGLAKRIVKSCFPQVVPVPQLEPLDASKIIKQEVKDLNTNKVCFALNDATAFKPITDEDAWEATLAWAEAKAQEREAAALKEVSETDTDESYDSDDSEVGVPIQPVSRLTSLFADDEVFEGPVRRVNIATWESGVRTGLSWAPWVEAERMERVAKKRYIAWVADVMVGVNTKAAYARVVAEKRAATIIQAAARGRALRAWKAQFTHELAREMPHIWRARYHTRMGMDAVEQQLAEQWLVSPKCVKAWILQGEQRSASAVLPHVSVICIQ